VVTLAAVRDLVCPLESTRLREATSITVPLGHSSLVVSERVYQRLIRILRGSKYRDTGSMPALDDEASSLDMRDDDLGDDLGPSADDSSQPADANAGDEREAPGRPRLVTGSGSG
jgi:hypothetical protein